MIPDEHRVAQMISRNFVRTGTMEENCKVPNLFLIEYNDGLRAALLMLNGFVFEPSAAAYAARVDGKVEACEIYLEGFPKHRPTDAASRANNFWRYYGELSRYRRHLGCILLKTTAVC